MSKIKGKESVRSAVESIYPQLPHRFSMISLYATVAMRIRRPYVYMDTVRRKLFELREEGKINFLNTDKAKSIYMKTSINKLVEVI